jgi:hypothetical protein
MNNMTILPIYSEIILVEKGTKAYLDRFERKRQQKLFFFSKNTKNPEKQTFEI